MCCNGYRKIDRKFDLDEVTKAEDLMTDFAERAAQVADVMFSSRYRIKSTGDAFLLPNGKVQVLYWDGYDGELYDNCALVFPFEWLNKTDEELKAMYRSYWNEQDEIARKYKEEQERKEAEEKRAKELVRESEGFKEYQKLKKRYEKYDT